MIVASAHGSAPYVGAIFALGVLMGLYFGFRFNVRALQFLVRLDMRLRGNRRPNFLEGRLLDIRLKDTAVRDVIGLAAGFAIAFIAIGFWQARDSQ
jgi:hypothetical protein